MFLLKTMNEMDNAVKFYKDVLRFDNMHVEAIACIATHHFYTDQPEVALKFYRRLLQMGVYNAELFNNLGLCCFYAQQYDMTLTCFERALSLADENTVSEIWFNIGHVAIGIGDNTLAYQAFRLALSNNNDHAEAYNNLGVLEMRKGHVDMARAFFQAAYVICPHMYEPHYNWAQLADQLGDLQSSYNSAKRAVEAFKDHVDSKDLLKQLQHHFAL
ncbi:TTC8-like protein, partial [Mya arenaria]